jgi:hypothetical protein
MTMTTATRCVPRQRVLDSVAAAAFSATGAAVVVGVGATPEEEAAAAALVEVAAVASAEPIIIILVIIEAASVPQEAAAAAAAVVVIYDDHRHPLRPPSPAQPLRLLHQGETATAAALAALRVDIPQVTVKHSANIIIIITVTTNSNIKTVLPKTTQCHYYKRKKMKATRKNAALLGVALPNPYHPPSLYNDEDRW